MNEVSSLDESGYSNRILTNTDKTEKQIVPVFHGNHISATIIILRKLAIKYELDDSCHVTIEDMGNGIYIKKARISD